jgi:hypothetical protein
MPEFKALKEKMNAPVVTEAPAKPDKPVKQ